MTENLQYALTTGVAAIGSYNDGSTFSFTPTSCSTNGDCMMNGNTRLYSGNWYYTWYVATAGKGARNVTSTDVNGSICPAHWKLPYAYPYQTNKSYPGLLERYGVPPENQNPSYLYAILEGDPLNFKMLGYMGSGTIQSSDGGYYWGSTSTATVQFASLLYYQNYRISPQADGRMIWGYIVRCVAL